MKIDVSEWGYLKPLVYVVVGIYTWIESVGINTYIFTVLFAFMLLDMLLGWIKATVVEGLENPSSKKAKKGILTKIILLQVKLSMI